VHFRRQSTSFADTCWTFRGRLWKSVVRSYLMSENFFEGGKLMWRVIVRISYFHDTGSKLRNNHVVPFFTALGLQNTATGTFESSAVDQLQAAALLSQVLQAIANPQQFNDVDSQAALKHLWVYIDRA
jgi:hypothetical protein